MVKARRAAPGHPPAQPQSEKFICLGCGDLDAEIITESDPTGTGEGDEICKKCGQNDFADNMEDAIATLVKSYSKMQEAYFELQHKTLDKKIEAARVPPEAHRMVFHDSSQINRKPDDPSWTIAWEEIKKERDGHLWSAGDAFQYREFFRLGWMACIVWAPEYPENLLNDRLLEAAKAVLDWYDDYTTGCRLPAPDSILSMRKTIEAIEKGTQGGNEK